MSEAQIATILLAAPFLALCAGDLVAQYFAIRAELAHLRSLRGPRIVARKDGRN